MDPGFSVSLLTVCLLGAARSNGSIGCPCPDIPIRDLTNSPSSECRQINSTFRYSCVYGYVRKAGTSNRVTCELKNGKVRWDFHSVHLMCIEDPKLSKIQSPKSTATSTESHNEFSGKTIITTRAKSHNEFSGKTIITTRAKSHNEFSGKTIITTRATAAPSSPQMNQDMNTSPSEAGGISVHTSVSNDPVMKIKLISSTRDTTTVLKDDTNSPPGALTGPAKAATISIVAIVIIVTVASIPIIILYRRRWRTTSQQPTEEQVPMNRGPAAVNSECPQ